jgi:hypothetical protein
MSTGTARPDRRAEGRSVVGRQGGDELADDGRWRGALDRRIDHDGGWWLVRDEGAVAEGHATDEQDDRERPGDEPAKTGDQVQAAGSMRRGSLRRGSTEAEDSGIDSVARRIGHGFCASVGGSTIATCPPAVATRQLSRASVPSLRTTWAA